MSTRNFEDAIDKLNSLQSNFAAIEASKASGGRMVQFAKHETIEYLGRIGYSPEDLNRLNVIHVTGTKGKGSTCAFVDSLLRSSDPERKIGLFTSPHLVSVRERIRINGIPISEEDFVRFFYEVWDRLEANDNRKYESTPAKPMYFKYLNLVAYHAFLTMKVDTAILEVGIGGEYDSTNIVPKPIVTGVTSLGLDHVATLGGTLAKIAWQKGGIYKTGVPAYTVPQPAEALEVLRERAEEKQSSFFQVVDIPSELDTVRLGIEGVHQRQNAALALHLVDTYLKAQRGAEIDKPSLELPLKPEYARGLEKARWPGRCQAVHDPIDPKSTWYLDGAHTVESLAACAEWFTTPNVGLRDGPLRVLIFNCTHGRSGAALLRAFREAAQQKLQAHHSTLTTDTLFDHVMFCTNVTYSDGTFKGEFLQKGLDQADLDQLKTQTELANAWLELCPSFSREKVHVLPSIQHAVKLAHHLRETQEKPVDVLVTGSLLLVGGLIEVANLTKVALDM
ncbi:Folylpolyglutamate synthase; AltName: Full=Folylpoly-gamma-glutamate synthetase; Short=FPGS; AltName: Full=Tetrahydrofolylpolyglutamate synthase; Short=Tetrahydrofolate synthase [Serendipita indica DSM 11827]|nr:Folylpolyglutamate synthase; AltName: Full=Folylpoly-gamma-glutamate synthetase; Short=FPGS; AltName: Full=Tetrahydrofolylpolyglutamate synthase; Short=Tetrahydrofolate synthase [Serendipita indica DSM 11827]